MNVKTQKNLAIQGFSEKDITTCDNIDMLARWTPVACSLFGIFGIVLQSSWYFIALGLLTSIGAFSKHSFYDYLYNYSIRFLINSEKIPEQGNARRLGCGIGAVMYIISGIGFSTGNFYLAYIPSLLMVVLAGFAAVTQICFASVFYHACTCKR